MKRISQKPPVHRRGDIMNSTGKDCKKKLQVQPQQTVAGYALG